MRGTQASMCCTHPNMSLQSGLRQAARRGLSCTWAGSGGLHATSSDQASHLCTSSPPQAAPSQPTADLQCGETWLPWSGAVQLCALCSREGMPSPPLPGSAGMGSTGKPWPWSFRWPSLLSCLVRCLLRVWASPCRLCCTRTVHPRPASPSYVCCLLPSISPGTKHST